MLPMGPRFAQSQVGKPDPRQLSEPALSVLRFVRDFEHAHTQGDVRGPTVWEICSGTGLAAGDVTWLLKQLAGRGLIVHKGSER